MKVEPLGGVKEVGRSCYKVDAEDSTVLVDCGIKQGWETVYPKFEKIGNREIDDVLVTHSHIDHTGGLPILVSENKLASDAEIVGTQPTYALTQILLHDSLKLHKMECNRLQKPQRYSKQDVMDVLDRFRGVKYGDAEVSDSIGVRFGDAGHILGSSWISITHRGDRVVFSGDLGGRSGHLKKIEEPPEADKLFLESTYGGKNNHRSMSDAKSELFQICKNAVEDGIPVLIPCFSIGRSQEILQTFRERIENFPDKTELVYDGLISDTTTVYHTYLNEDWLQDSILNYVRSCSDIEPFLPEGVKVPETTEEREEMFEGDGVPVVVAPSGMMQGGWSPFYLKHMVESCSEGKIVFVGYQAKGTPGRDIQDIGEDECRDVVIETFMHGEESSESNVPDEEFGVYEKTLEIDGGWVETVNGFSGHCAANSLLSFARDVDAEETVLVHGDGYNQDRLKSYLSRNLDSDVRLVSAGDSIDISGARQYGSIERDVSEEVLEKMEKLDGKIDFLSDRITRLEREVFKR